MSKGIGKSFTIENPFKPLGALKTGCINCKGCKNQYFGFTAFPCSLCSRNVRNRNTNAKDYFERKK